VANRQIDRLLLAEGRVGGRRRKLTEPQRAEIAESVLSGRKPAAEMARLYKISQPTVSRIVLSVAEAMGVTGWAEVLANRYMVITML